MRKFALLFLLTTLVLLTACHDDNGGETPEETTRVHAVLVYMPYTGPSGALTSIFKQNIEDMKTGLSGTGKLASNHLIIYMAQGPRVAKLFRLTEKDGSIVADTLKTYNDQDQTTTEGIAEVLADMKAAATAETYSLIIGCHGEGWLPRTQSTPSLSRKRHYFGGTSYAYQADIDTLSEAISTAGLHFEYILFDDCYIASIEDAYSLRSNTHYLLGSTSEVMAQGLPYSKVIRYLMGPDPDYEAVCDGFYNYYASSSTPYGNFGVIDCTEAENMAALMKQANSLYLNSYDFDASAIQDLDVSHWDPTVYFDFLDYARALCKDDALYQQIASEMEKLVPYKRGLPSIYSAIGRTAIPLTSYCGISISDPSLNTVAVEAKKQTGWWKATH